MKNKNASEIKNATTSTIEISTTKLEEERKNYGDYLYQNTTEYNLTEIKKRRSLQEKEDFLHDALMENENQKLSKAECFDRYKIVANRVSEHYATLDATNSALTIDDLSVQTHLILLPILFINPVKIKAVVLSALDNMWDKIKTGKVVLFNDRLLFDTLKFERKVVPVCVINSKLIPSKYIINFLRFADEKDDDSIEILEAFSKILENALNARFYVKLNNEVIVLRKGKQGEEQNQLFISEKSLNNTFSNVKERERSEEIYDNIDLDKVVSNKTNSIITMKENYSNHESIIRGDDDENAQKIVDVHEEVESEMRKDGDVGELFSETEYTDAIDNTDDMEDTNDVESDIDDNNGEKA